MLVPTASTSGLSATTVSRSVPHPTGLAYRVCSVRCFASAFTELMRWAQQLDARIIINLRLSAQVFSAVQTT